MLVTVADSSHIKYAHSICDTIEESAKIRGTGIAKRTPEYIIAKIENGNAVIALDGDNFAGFCYIEAWGHEKYVANSGLIVHPDYRGQGLARTIKKKIFEHSLIKYPNAKVFGITTGLPVMKINYELGYEPVTFSELTDDPTFWSGCGTCKNFDILTRTERKMCLCTGMLYDPEKKKQHTKYEKDKAVLKRLKNIKQALFLKREDKKK
ncbi:GNAT family N-acetyltransferase [Ascidiimonas sp. W6]|uniref:GNAT family N-acetyltransferase n=1 Tax=Ascidiimonas meishanensis TaxID=3128903 RepID=UPI0030EF31F1